MNIQKVSPQMSTREHFAPKPQDERKTVPFSNAQEAWFWFIQAQAAMNDGARSATGLNLVPRPCEPVDILKAVDRLVRNRCLVRDHLIVMRHYGRRLMPPDARRVHEAKADRIWREAMGFLGEALIRKGIVFENTQPLFKEEMKYEFADCR